MTSELTKERVYFGFQFQKSPSEWGGLTAGGSRKGEHTSAAIKMQIQGKLEVE